MTTGEPSCELRAFGGEGGQVRIVTRNLSLRASGQLGLDVASDQPSSLDLMLSALATDLLAGFGREATRAGVELRDLELRLSARLENPLVALGVIGESGSPGLVEVRGRLDAAGITDEPLLRALWLRALDHAPVHTTLKRAAKIAIDLRLHA